MLTCSDAAPYLARASDEPDAIDGDARLALDAHLEGCAACRAAFDTQRAVATWLRMRPSDRISSEFAARLSARLDAASGWFGIADWRVWTLRLAPVAAVLALATILGIGSPADRAISIDDWTLVTSEASSPATLLQSDVSPESLVETLITGELPAAPGGTRDVR